ncbi:hypothetical protein B0H14DRAFT_3017392 [Mycena olivaceomarginata]|nr:hypothetical protein B0H14DRAFT_3017392 [Mycena olivaceomarginata]
MNNFIQGGRGGGGGRGGVEGGSGGNGEGPAITNTVENLANILMQFFVGYVPNHAESATQPNTSPASLDTVYENRSALEIYWSQLIRQKRGYPLYVPQPQINLPAEYREHGVAIGDVGRVTPEGTFDFFFNIFLPSEHPIHANGTPEDFAPMAGYKPKDVHGLNHPPGSFVATHTVRKVNPVPPPDDFPAGNLHFSCDGPRGAVLALPDGSEFRTLLNVNRIRNYAAEHAESWYQYSHGTQGREVANGDLYLVTGWEKARSWGMASYTSREEFKLTFKPTLGWSGPPGERNPAREKSHVSPSTNAPLNQTTFLHGLSISLGKGLWDKLFGTVTVEISSICDSRIGGFHTTSPQGSLFSWAGGTRHAGAYEDIASSDFPPTAMVFNPAKLINAYILHKAPQTTVVMSHDDDWCDILGDESEIANLSVFFQRIDDRFTITEKDGATSLVSKSGHSRNSFPMGASSDEDFTMDMEDHMEPLHFIANNLKADTVNTAVQGCRKFLRRITRPCHKGEPGFEKRI